MFNWTVWWAGKVSALGKFFSLDLEFYGVLGDQRVWLLNEWIRLGGNLGIRQ